MKSDEWDTSELCSSNMWFLSKVTSGNEMVPNVISIQDAKPVGVDYCGANYSLAIVPPFGH